MNRVEVKTNNQFLAEWLVITGTINVRKQEQLLLPAPKKLLRRSNLDFDPNLEVQALAELPETEKRPYLESEIKTTLNEFFLSQMGHIYEIRDGQLVDDKTGLDIEKITLEGCVQEEYDAIQRIKRFMNSGADQVVHISQKNKNLGYPDNVVDIWLKCKDGKIRTLRSRVAGDEKTFNRFYERIGGKIDNPDKMQILADPVEVTNLRLSEILDLLVIEECEAKFGEEDIEKVTKKLIVDFEKKFGERLTSDPETILRLYLAVKDAMMYVGTGNKATIDKTIGDLPSERYLSSPMKVVVTQGHGCGINSLEGAFAKQGWILTFKDGNLTSYFGSTEGLNYCKRCGCWHKGSKCPYCDKD